ncbi:hypothetical protein KSS87_000260, partial [Heliosperma pusillum]
MILMSPLSSTSVFRYRVSVTPFVYATNCSDNVVILLLQKFEDWIEKVNKNGFSILHQWTEEGETGPCKILLEGDYFANMKTKIFKVMIFGKEKESSDTPLHIAARKVSELGQILIHGYQQEPSKDNGQNQDIEAVDCPPWKIKNIHGNTPFHCALSFKHEDLA